MLGLAGHSPVKPWVLGAPGEASVEGLWVGHSWLAHLALGAQQLGVAGALVAFLLVTMLGVGLGVPGETGADQVPLHLLLLVAVAS